MILTAILKLNNIFWPFHFLFFLLLKQTQSCILKFCKTNCYQYKLVRDANFFQTKYCYAKDLDSEPAEVFSASLDLYWTTNELKSRTHAENIFWHHQNQINNRHLDKYMTHHTLRWYSLKPQSPSSCRLRNPGTCRTFLWWTAGRCHLEQYQDHASVYPLNTAEWCLKTTSHTSITSCNRR